MKHGIGVKIMNDPEKNYWENQLKIYNSLNFSPDKKYLEWQPARWSSNGGAIKNILEKAKDIKTVCEVGAGSAAFALEMYRQKNDLKLTAIDRSIIASNYGKKIAKDMNIPINYITDDVFLMTHQRKYDLVLSLGVIEHYNYEKQIKFVKKCIELSNKYILIAIPNQESIIFKSYLNWCKKNNNNYEEEHKKFDTKKLLKLIKKCDLKPLIVDGFQLYLSESDFLGQTSKENFEYIGKLKKALLEQNANIGKQFPNYNFCAKDVTDMMNAELSFSKDERLKLSFMTYILCKK